MGTSKNIIIGAASVFIGPSLSETAGANVDAKIAAWRPAVVSTTSYRTTVAGTVGWRDVGYTSDGLDISTDPSWGEVEVDQLLDSAKIFKDGMKFTMNTTLSESTLENILVAWGQDDTISSSANEHEIGIQAGSLGAAPKERGVIVVGNGPEKTGSNAYSERTYFLYRALSVDSASMKMERASASTVPVSFRALPADNTEYGRVRDRFNVV